MRFTILFRILYYSFRVLAGLRCSDKIVQPNHAFIKINDDLDVIVTMSEAFLRSHMFQVHRKDKQRNKQTKVVRRIINIPKNPLIDHDFIGDGMGDHV